MRIGYNCRFLHGPLTGVQRIAGDLLEALLRLDGENTYVAFLCGRGGRHLEALDRPNVEVVGADRDVRGRLGRQAWEQETLPRLARRANLDVIHHPANTAPRRGLVRAVVSIYDASFLAHPEWFSRAFHWYYRWLIPSITRRAARIITASEFSKAELVGRLGLAPRRVAVVYPGVSDRFLSVPSPSTREGQGGGDRSSAAPPFVLFVGGTNPRKNLAGLLAAMERLRADPSFTEVGLKVVGASTGIFAKRGSAGKWCQTPWWKGPSERPSSAALGPSARSPAVKVSATIFPRLVQFLDAVDEETLIDLYRTAACLCYPSFYEGFGLPPLEALACGTPVVAADIPVLREVLGAAAVFADPADPAAIAAALARVLADGALRADLLRRGRDRVGRFTWAAAARQTLDVYRDAAADASA